MYVLLWQKPTRPCSSFLLFLLFRSKKPIKIKKQEQNLFISCEKLKSKLLLEYSFCLILLDNLSITSIYTAKQHLKLLDAKITWLCPLYCILTDGTPPRCQTPFEIFVAKFCALSMWTTMINLEVLSWKMTDLFPF